MRQLEYLLDPIQVQLGSTDTNAPENTQDVVGRGRIQYALGESEAKKKLRIQKFGNEIDSNLEIVSREYIEQFEKEWQEFDKSFEEIFEVKPWSDSK